MFRSQPLRNEGFFLFVGLLAGAWVGMGGGRGEGGITQRGKDKEDGELEGLWNSHYMLPLPTSTNFREQGSCNQLTCPPISCVAVRTLSLPVALPKPLS